MFSKVLVALDFSPSSQNILDRIREIPGVREVVLLHVVDATHPSRRGWTHGPEIENAKLRLAEKKADLEKAGLKVQATVDVIVSVITEGDVARAILEAAETHRVSLIVVGARGINPIRELLLGSVSSSVLRHAKTHVLVFHSRTCPPDTASPSQELFSKLLVPTDFSRSAGETLSLVAAIPGIRDLILLHVISRAESEPEIEASVAETRDRLDAMKKELKNAGLTVLSRIRIGDPAEMILSVAADDAPSLVALNAFGTGLLREMLLGSTTFTVVRKAEIPVLVIRSEPEP